MTKIAIIKSTNEQVFIVAVNGGWTTVRDQAGVEKKVRNGALTEPVEIKAPTTAKLLKAKAADTATSGTPKAPRAKKPLHERQNGRVDAVYLQFYQGYKAERADGVVIRSVDKGDDVALAMRPLTLAQAYEFAASKIGCGVKDLQARFEHLNPGMQRMNLGNMVRRVLREAANV